MKNFTILLGGTASLGGIIGLLYGELDGVFLTLIFFVASDYIKSVTWAIHDKMISSKIGFKGICKKVLIFMMVALGYTIDNYVIKSGDVLKTGIMFFYISNEGISILENISHIGLPIPKSINGVFAKLHKDNDK